jgi:predicted alpha-1,2-mannosidase
MRILLFCVLLGSVHAQEPTRYVNPFIGTTNGGNTFPGAVRPWGMVSVSPHTAPGTPSGYIHGAPWFYGLGHVHLSGTGCADLGSIVLTASRHNVRPDPEQHKTAYADEEAKPGYYAVRLPDEHLRCEATATARAGVTRFTSDIAGDVTLLIDAGRSLALLGGGGVAWRTPSEVEGFNIAGGFCGEANRQRVYFSARFSRPGHERGTWINERVSGRAAESVPDSSVGAWARFTMKAGESVIVAVGISYVSTGNARLNLNAEAASTDFDALVSDAAQVWERELSRVRVEGGSRDDMVKFTTALYHVLLHPNIINDVNGDYPLMGRAGVGRYAGRDRYTVFSLWDTYRTLHPFLTLAYPERQSAIVRTMVDMATESGWLPKWELASNETHMMVGDPAVPVIADSYIKGIRDFDTSAAYAAMKRGATTPGPESDPLRPGYHDMLRLGYIPADQDTTQQWWVWGPASTTLEYCFADWALGTMAAALGRATEAKEFFARSLFYRNLFDTTGLWIRPRRADGTWLHPFDPERTEGSGSWSGSGGPGYVEGNAWNYTWFVPHDIQGLISLFGGATPFARKLDESFARGQFTITNEPDIAYPYLFTYAPGWEHRTREIVRAIMTKDFDTGPGGLPGNDDAGAISAWFVFSALGFYPDCPASGTYRLGLPLFRKAVVELNPRYYNGGRFTVERRPGPAEWILLNDKHLDGFGLRHDAIVHGGRLVFISVDEMIR